MKLEDYPKRELKGQVAYRLIPSKFPPIDLFEDVASHDEFEALFEIQKATNPRLLNDIGELHLLPKEEIPFGIQGCSYAIGAFTHVNPEGSRFSDGDFGVLYLADTTETGIAETRYHQERNFQSIEGLKSDTITMRCLKLTFNNTVVDISSAPEEIYAPDDYSSSRALGHDAKTKDVEGLQYNSVRKVDATCWAMFTPKGVEEAIQTKHFQYLFDGETIHDVLEVSKVA